MWLPPAQQTTSAARPKPSRLALTAEITASRCQKVTSERFLNARWDEPQFHRPHHRNSHASSHEHREIANMNTQAEGVRVGANLGKYGRRAESDCARAMAEAERVLRELSSSRSSQVNPAPGRPSTADAPSLVRGRSGWPSLAPPSIDRLTLDPGLDFVIHADGMIELTEAGFRRMGQAHAAGLNTAIEADQREVLHFPAPKLRCAPRS